MDKTCRFHDIAAVWFRIKCRSAYNHNNNEECYGLLRSSERERKKDR